MTDELLKHEQGHYKISALLARDFYDSIKKIVAFLVTSLKEV